MAKDARDREDLLRDTTGYTQRIELRVDGVDPTIFCGFRPEGALSIYWGQDEVIQFNSSHELRRAFFEERMLASYRHRLHWLNRSSASHVKLSRELVPEEAAARFLTVWEQRIKTLYGAMKHEHFQVLGQIPRDGDIAQQLADWLGENAATIRLAMHPGVG